MRSILDPLFRYTSSQQTDIRKTFARVRNEARSARRAVMRNEMSVACVPPPAQRKRASP